MAINKFINSKNIDTNDLKRIIEYVRNEGKTSPDLIGGYCCDRKYPFEDMCVTKQLNNKTAGKQYEHYIIAFDPNDDVDPEWAFAITNDIVKYHKKHQSFWAIHTNTNHVHAHIIMNSVAGDGTKFRQWKPQLAAFKDYIGCICRKNGISSISRTFGSPPVEDINCLEFTDDELKESYGGIIMNNKKIYTDPFTGLSTYNDDNNNDYDNNYDLDVYDPEQYQEIQSNRKHLYMGNTFNLNVSSMEQAEKFISSCQFPNNLSINELKHIMDYLGNDVAYHVGHQFNVDLSNMNDNTINAEYQDID